MASKQRENDDDEQQPHQRRLHLQGRVPLQPLHLQELQLLNGEDRAGDGAVPSTVDSAGLRSDAIGS